MTTLATHLPDHLPTSPEISSPFLPRGTVPPHSEVAPGDIAVGVIIGRASEYFDFFVYGIASALIFPAVFFPFAQPLQATLYAFIIFSFAFLTRPIGTAVFMAIERRWGRGTKLTASLFLLGTATAGIAFLPGHGQIGVWSIVLLAAFRLVQGLALGGTWDGLPSLLALNAPPHKRGWYAMLGQLGAPLGFVIAAALFAYLYSQLSFDDLHAWGWRYPFFVAFALNVVALFARLRLVVTHEYDQQLGERELTAEPVHTVLQAQGSNVLIGAFAALASYALFHIVTIFPLSWIQLYSGQSLSGVLSVQIVGAVLAAGAVVVSGLLADKIGRRSTLGIFAVLIALFSFVAPVLLDAGQAGQHAFIIAGFVLLGLSYGQSTGAVTSNFEPRLRYTGAAFTVDIAWLIGAAFAPLVALGLSSHYGLWAVGAYLLSGAAATLIALRINRNRQPVVRDTDD
ncbi:MFS transporter [Xylophilus sp.]|uniref:MFS transporter n=1 Tax=Xylophilus sp. TaxID=2653893 RepID=UPI0013B61429|nr:MFS transporter [Xylophilus sp.]KAF1047813.1 MAG: Inner membrane metabolite transport protein YhjE [Xylophilus sp.]